MSHAVDVILPTHRRPHTVRFAIESVLRQQSVSLALHVVGDGCTPETARVIDSFEDKRLTFHAFTKSSGAATSNINRVLRETSAPYVAYMTDDDLWFPDHLQRALTELERGDSALVAFRPAAVVYPDAIDPYLFAFDWNNRFWTGVMRHRFVGLETFVHHRSVLNDVGYFDEAVRRFNDNDFYNRVRRSRAGARYVDVITVLRFYARHWDRHYGAIAEPPQRVYLERLGDPSWHTALRDAATHRSPVRVRVRQAAEFVRLAVRSGVPFMRCFLHELARARSAS